MCEKKYEHYLAYFTSSPFADSGGPQVDLSLPKESR